jgi:hypothetical protein
MTVDNIIRAATDVYTIAAVIYTGIVLARHLCRCIAAALDPQPRTTPRALRHRRPGR